MKAKELITILSENPDFDVEFKLDIIDETGYNITNLKLDHHDVGYSDKTIALFLEMVD